MALFGSKKKEIKKDAQAPLTKTVSKAVKAKPVKKESTALALGTETLAPSSSYVADVILRPRITEKSGLLSQQGIYTFEVITSATKNAVTRAVFATYKVMPVKVAMINLPSRKVVVRGRRGVIPGTRKAIVTLKKGDKIDFV